MDKSLRQLKILEGIIADLVGHIQDLKLITEPLRKELLGPDPYYAGTIAVCQVRGRHGDEDRFCIPCALTATEQAEIAEFVGRHAWNDRGKRSFTWLEHNFLPEQPVIVEQQTVAENGATIIGKDRLLRRLAQEGFK